MAELTRRIALIGLRGSGKTTVGRYLAERLNLPFLDMDEELVRVKGKSIPEWVGEEGWESFRDAEEYLLKSMTAHEPVVLSTGGGVIGRESSRLMIREHFFGVYLHWPPLLLAHRIRNDANRPPLKPGTSLNQEVKELYTERDPLYREAASLVLQNTATTSVNDILLKLLKALQ